MGGPQAPPSAPPFTSFLKGIIYSTGHLYADSSQIDASTLDLSQELQSYLFKRVGWMFSTGYYNLLSNSIFVKERMALLPQHHPDFFILLLLCQFMRNQPRRPPGTDFNSIFIFSLSLDAHI